MSRSKHTLSARLVETAKPQEKPYEIPDNSPRHGVRGLLMRVQPSGMRSFVVQLRRGQRVTIGRPPVMTLAMAREQAKKVIANGGAIVEKQAEKRVTLGAFIDGEYAAHARAHLRAPDDALKRLRFCFGHWWKRPLTDITEGMVELHRAKERRRGISPATINRDIGRLSSVLTRAVKFKHLDAHPLIDLQPLKLDKAHVVRYLSEDEDKRLRAALDNAPDYVRTMVLVSLNTGLRRKELFTLSWPAVDLKRRQLTVVGSLSKTGQTRHVPLNRKVVETLREWRDKTGGDGLLFRSHTGARFNNTQRSWANLLDDAGISGFRWHDLRHDFASKLVMRGVDLYTVSRLLGHSSVELTKRYAHLAPDHLADAVARLDR